MIRLFYYEPDLQPETSLNQIRDNLKNLVDGKFTQNDLLIVDHSTYTLHFWPNNGIDNKHLILDAETINYEKIANQKLNNIFIYDFRLGEVRSNQVMENLIKIKSVNCDIFGISFRDNSPSYRKMDEGFLPSTIRKIEDMVMMVKDLKSRELDDEEIIVLLKLKENYSDQTIDTIMNYYVCKNQDIDLKSVASFDEIIKHKRI